MSDFKSQSAATIAANKKMKAERHANRMAKQVAHAGRGMARSMRIREKAKAVARSVHTQATAIRAAFENIKVMPSAFKAIGDCAEHIAKSLHGKAGITNELDWNAKLSMKTAETLGAPLFNPTKTKLVDGQKVTWSTWAPMHTGTFNKMCA